MVRHIEDDEGTGYMPDYLPNRKVYAIKSHFRSYWYLYLIGGFVLVALTR